MTVNKITSPPSQKGVIDKINEVIDNLGGGGGGLPSQTGQSGKFLTTDGTDASWASITFPTVDQTYNASSANAQSGVAINGAKFLRNTATGAESLTLLGVINTYSSGINIGAYSEGGDASVSLGNASEADDYATAIGNFAQATAEFSTALGKNAHATGGSAIQIGEGTNSTNSSLSIGFNNNGSTPTNYQLLDGTTGLIPYQRINSLTETRNNNQLKFWTGTKAQYDAIVTKDANTLYNITDDANTTLSLLELLFPVGATYIGKMATCPLATLGIGTWQLKSSRFLVDKYNNGTDWWELYSDGWCRQGGQTEGTTDGLVSVTFLKEFSTSNPNIQLTRRFYYSDTTNYAYNFTSGISNVSSTGFTCYDSAWLPSGGSVAIWEAEGYTSTVTQLNQWERIS